MSKEDRNALHTAMEQQIVTIDKANIHITLRAETSILAAANPKGGRFTDDRDIIEQIDLPPTLMSRFDLIFPLRDRPNPERDMEIAKHVILAHKTPDAFKPAIDINLLRKYIAYAKKVSKPIISEEAMERISNFYVDLREKGKERNMITITTRQLEAIIRLAEASARVR
jgi:replicative DNA helicase Mcm